MYVSVLWNFFRKSRLVTVPKLVYIFVLIGIFPLKMAYVILNYHQDRPDTLSAHIIFILLVQTVMSPAMFLVFFPESALCDGPKKRR